MSGWFALKHGIVDHPIFKRKPLRLAAWVWMLDKTAWKDTEQDVNGEIVTIRRGELCASQAMLQSASGMTRQQLRTFMDVLKSEGVISTRPTHNSTKSRTIITICNYEKYQQPKPKGNQEPTKEQPTKEQGNNIPVGGAADAAPDPAKIMFDSGRRILTEAGKSHAEAGRLLGKWRRDHGEEAVISALGRCQREGAIDPVSFIEGCFKFHRRNQPTERPGYTNAGAFGMIPEVG